MDFPTQKWGAPRYSERSGTTKIGGLGGQLEVANSLLEKAAVQRNHGKSPKGELIVGIQ